MELSGDDGKEGFKDFKFEMSPPTQQELSSRQSDGSLEPRVEIRFENINLKVISMQMTFNAKEIDEVK